MSLPPLATPEQLAARLSMAPPSAERIDAALADASAAVRRYTSQEITYRISTVRTKVVPPGVLILSQRPVTEIVEVLGLDGSAVGYYDRGLGTLAVAAYRNQALDVTYGHGYDEIPDDIVAVVCNVAARTLGTGPETGGLTQESITNYSSTYGPVGAAGPVGIFAEEKRTLDAYIVPAGPVWMAPA
jgi:hypothetical protein